MAHRALDLVGSSHAQELVGLFLRTYAIHGSSLLLLRLLFSVVVLVEVDVGGACKCSHATGAPESCSAASHTGPVVPSHACRCNFGIGVPGSCSAASRRSQCMTEQVVVLACAIMLPAFQAVVPLLVASNL